MSGVTISKAAEEAIQDVTKKRCGIAIFKLSETQTEIIVDKVLPLPSSGEEALRELKESLPKAEPRYALLDFHFETHEHQTREKVVFIAWSPDDSIIRQKMLYASSKKYIQSCVGSAKIVQATDMDELDMKEIMSKCIK